MLEASRDMDTSAEGSKVGPNYFDYYTREVACVLSQIEDLMPFVSQTSDLAGRTCKVNRETDITKHSYTGKEGNSSEAGSLFCDPLGEGISDFKKERLKVLLRQSVVLLSQEVDEMVDPVFAMLRIQRCKMKVSSCPSATCEDNGERPHKKHKLSSSSSIRSNPISCIHNGEGSGNENMYLAKPGEAISNVVNNMCSNCLTTETSRWSSDSEVLKVNDDLQLLLETESARVEETMKKISDELSKTLGCKKQKLEELIDTVMSNCRLMTLAEKQHLQILIRKLPLRNLDRVVEIIQRSKPSAKHSSNDVFVDLERVDNTTLWRLYCYVQAVENARKLSVD